MLAVIQDAKTMLRCTSQCSHVALYTKMLHLGLTLCLLAYCFPWKHKSIHSLFPTGVTSCLYRDMRRGR